MKKVTLTLHITIVVVLMGCLNTENSLAENSSNNDHLHFLSRHNLDVAEHQGKPIQEKLIELVNEYRANYGSFGVLFSFLKDDRITTYVAGDIKGSDHLRIASVSKIFFAWLFLKEGFDPDQPVSFIFPEDQFPYSAEITARKLLSHTSGIPDEMIHHTRNLDEEMDPQLVSESIREFIGTPAPSPRERITEIYNAETGLDFGPGKHWCYSNTGYVMIGYMLERNTGIKAGDLLKQYFGEIAPSMYLDDGRLADFPAAYHNPWPIHHTGPWVAGGVIAKAEDVLRAMSFIVSQPEFEPMQQWANQPHCEMEIVFGDQYGLGLQRYRFGEYGDALGHDGHIMARTFLFYINGSSYLLHTTNYISNTELKSLAEKLLGLM